jgi:hypothetical protein
MHEPPRESAREVRNPTRCRMASENTTEECEPNEKIARRVISGAIRVAIAPRELARPISQPIIWQIENAADYA